MSANNDALKQANETRENSPPVSVANLQIRPAEPERPDKPGLRLTLPSVGFVVLLFVFIALGALLMLKVNQKVRAKAATQT